MAWVNEEDVNLFFDHVFHVFDLLFEFVISI